MSNASTAATGMRTERPPVLGNTLSSGTVSRITPSLAEVVSPVVAAPVLLAPLVVPVGVPVVPVVVSGAHRCWPKGSAFTYPAHVSVQILDPISTTHWTAKNLDRHVAEVHARFVEHLPDDQKPVSAPATLVSQQ